MSVFLSMAIFALVSSITPGPVNLLALNSGARYGVRRSVAHITGATSGFTLLLVLIGLGLDEVLQGWPWLTTAIRLGGVVYLLYLAARLASDNGELDATEQSRPPSMFAAAAMQWLNPKAWLAGFAGMGAFAADGNSMTVVHFAVIYFIVCYASIACWAIAGALLRQHFTQPARVRVFNRGMALLLTLCAVGLMIE